MENIDYQNINISAVLNKEAGKLPSFINSFSIFYSLENSANLYINGSCTKLKENCVVFINKNIIHSIEVQPDSKIYEFRFSERLISVPSNPEIMQKYISPISLNPDLDYINLGPRSKSYVSLISFLDKLIEIEKEKSEFYDYDVIKSLYSVWSIITQNLSLATFSKKKKSCKMSKDIIRYVESNYFKKITMNEIAKNEESSLVTCYRNFKSFTGYSIHEYLKRFRLYKSIDLLLSTNKKATQIALETGFVGKNQFTLQFKKEFGCTPIKFKNDNINPTLD